MSFWFELIKTRSDGADNRLQGGNVAGWRRRLFDVFRMVQALAFLLDRLQAFAELGRWLAWMQARLQFRAAEASHQVSLLGVEELARLRAGLL